MPRMRPPTSPHGGRWDDGGIFRCPLRRDRLQRQPSGDRLFPETSSRRNVRPRIGCNSPLRTATRGTRKVYFAVATRNGTGTPREKAFALLASFSDPADVHPRNRRRPARLFSVPRTLGQDDILQVEEPQTEDWRGFSEVTWGRAMHRASCASP